MKIAVIGAKGLPPQQGGVEYHCAEIYPRMVAQGHSVDLFARASYNQSYSWESYDYEGVLVKPIPSLAWQKVDAVWSSAMAAIATTGQRYDVIHFHGLGPALWSGVPRFFSPCSNIVVTCHGLDWQKTSRYSVSNLLIQRGERCAVRYGHEVVVIAKELQPYFEATYNRQLPYIGNGPATYTASDHHHGFIQSQGLRPQRYLLFLGRLAPEKCPDLLMKAFQTLRPEGWKLAIAGATTEDSYTAQLMALAMDDPDIVFMGSLKGRNLAETMRGAGLCVLPSKRESLPLVLLEAMNEAIPILASDIPVHCRLLGENRGLLFKTACIDDCVTQLRWAIGNYDVMQSKAKRAKAHIQEHHDWDCITADLLTLYRKACASRCSTPHPASL